MDCLGPAFQHVPRRHIPEGAACCVRLGTCLSFDTGRAWAMVSARRGACRSRWRRNRSGTLCRLGCARTKHIGACWVDCAERIGRATARRASRPIACRRSGSRQRLSAA
jgi:hypothetical protein